MNGSYSNQGLIRASVPPKIEWERSFHGPNNNGGVINGGVAFAQQTSDGGYIAVGTIWFPNTRNGSQHIYLVKTDANGNKQWDTKFGRSDGDVAAGIVMNYGAVQQTSDGGYIIVGHILYNYVAWKIDIYLVKTDANGNKQWDKTYSKWTANYGASVQQTSDGGYIIVGQVVTDWNKDREVYFMKTDANGDKVWDKIFGDGKGGDGASVQQTTDGGYILTGATDGNQRVYLVKTDANGNKQWDKTFGGNFGDAGYSVQQTRDGGYIVTGEINAICAESYTGDIYLVKTDANGNKQWDKTFGNSGWDRGVCVLQNRDGGYIVARFTNGSESNSNYTSTAYLVKTDANGNKQWDKAFGSSGSCCINSIQQTSDGGYIIAGCIDIDQRGCVNLVKLGPETPTPTPLPTATPMAPLSMTNVKLVLGYPRYLMWEVSYTGSGYTSVTPNASLYATNPTSPGFTNERNITAQYVYDTITKTLSNTTISFGYDWAQVNRGLCISSFLVQ